MKHLPFILILFLSSCGQYTEDRRSEDFEPIYLGDGEEQEIQSSYGAIYKPNQSGLFAMESRAHRVGAVSYTHLTLPTTSRV